MVQENVDILIKVSTEDLGFSNGKPVVTYIIYKSLIHWKLFEQEKTNVFDRLITVFGSAIQVRCYKEHINMFLQNAEVSTVVAIAFILIYWGPCWEIGLKDSKQPTQRQIIDKIRKV